jgi:predicted type IV restriction endonuclease
MDLAERLQALALKISKQRDMIQTEEATKNAFVLPFISSLGYDVFDPSEVVPEFTADFGTKKGEKVDFAIKRDNTIIMLIECKQCGASLQLNGHASQLYRYFSVTTARVAILTNGIQYRFFTDLEEPNKMDSKPFMEVDILELQDQLVQELRRLTKQHFNLDEVIANAGDLRFTRDIMRVLNEQLQSPSEDLVRFFASQVYTGKLTQAVRDKFTIMTKRALNQFINDRINERLRSAMTDTLTPPAPAVTSATNAGDSSGSTDPTPADIVTTTEEIEAYFLVKSILRETVDPRRIVYRDMQSYCGILLDNNNRKPLCRLHFNRKQKYLGIFTSDKKEERVPISQLDDIFTFADRLKETALQYPPG